MHTKGVSEALTEVIAGRADCYFALVFQAKKIVDSGKLIALATSSPKRSALMPNIPTLEEQGFQNASYNFWVGALVPAKTPRAIVEQLNRDITAVVESPEVTEHIKKLGCDPLTGTVKDFEDMKQIGVAVVGTGWCGGIRAEALASHALVKSLHIAEVKAERLNELKARLNPATATADYKQLVDRKDIEAVYISATPESTHYPMAKDFLSAGKHVFLEKPIAMTLSEADELIKISRDRKLKFTIGYSQRFNPKYAYVRKSIRDKTIGTPVTALVSRHITRMLGTKISGRSKLSPAANSRKAKSPARGRSAWAALAAESICTMPAGCSVAALVSITQSAIKLEYVMPTYVSTLMRRRCARAWSGASRSGSCPGVARCSSISCDAC